MTVAGASVAAAKPETDADAAFLKALRSMDASAWEQVYADHHAAIYRYARYRLQDPDRAEDIAAEVFVQAVRSIGRYRDHGRPLLAWLYGIAQHVIGDEVRRQVRQLPYEPGPDQERTESSDPTAQAADRQALLGALRSLTGDQQQVVILRFIEDRPLADTAKLMGRPVGAVKVLQFRAVRRLRTLLSEEAC